MVNNFYCFTDETGIRHATPVKDSLLSNKAGRTGVAVPAADDFWHVEGDIETMNDSEAALWIADK